MKSFSWQSLYFYAVCFVCVCALIIVSFNFIDSVLSTLIKVKGFDNSMTYNLKSIIENAIYIAILVPIYVWHWRRVQKLSE